MNTLDILMISKYFQYYSSYSLFNFYSKVKLYLYVNTLFLHHLSPDFFSIFTFWKFFDLIFHDFETNSKLDMKTILVKH